MTIIHTYKSTVFESEGEVACFFYLFSMTEE